MKKFIKPLIILWLAGFMSACNHPRSNFSEVPVVNDSTALEAKVDSAHTIRQDGLDYNPLNTGTYNQLPEAVTQWLNEKYAGWSLPTISEDYLKKTKRTAPGPFYLETDLNQDQLLDYAVLYQYQDSVTVAVYLTQKTGRPQEFGLERQPLKSTPQEDKSLPYLTWPKKETKIFNTQENKRTVLPKQTFGVVGKENNIRYYFYNGKNFSVLAGRQVNF